MTDSSYFRIGTSEWVRSRNGVRSGLVVRDRERAFRAFEVTNSDLWEVPRGVLIGSFPSYRAAVRAVTGEDDACPWCGASHLGVRCPEDRRDAELRIRHMLDVRIPGQTRKIADSYRADLAKEVNYWRHTREWGPDVYHKLLKDPLMGPHLMAAAKESPTLYGMIEQSGPMPTRLGHNGGPPLDDNELTEQQKNLALSWHLLKFVDESANKYGGKRPGLIDDLVTIGRGTLERCAKSHDPQRGPFENYAKATVKKEMLKKCREHRILYGTRIKNDKAVKRHRSSTGGYKDKSYIAAPSKPRQSRLIADALDEELVTTLKRDEQIGLRHVFKNGDNPRSIRLLARKLDLTERRTRDVVKNAKAKYEQAVRAKNFRPK